MAQDMFRGYEVKIVGSNDKPHWQEPQMRVSNDQLREDKWYDVYGVTPAYQVQHKQQRALDLQASANNSTFQDLGKLKAVSGASKRQIPSILQGQKAQKAQKRQQQQ